MMTDKDIRKKILLQLFNSNSTGFTDIKPTIKSLGLTRKDIIDFFSVLEYDGIATSDEQWRHITITSAGVTPTVDQVQFNFRLTLKGEQLVIDRYLPKQPNNITADNVHIGDNFGDYSQSATQEITKNKTVKRQTTIKATLIKIFVVVAGGVTLWLLTQFVLLPCYHQLLIFEILYQ